jgi:hypothetical protein
MVMLRVVLRALELTVKVTVEVPAPGAAMDEGLKPTVTPEGWPDADKATAALKPPATVVVTVAVPLLPLVTDIEVGETETAKLGGTVTVRLTVVVWVRPPPVPVMVIGYVPVAAVVPTVRVRVDVPEPGAAMEVLLKLTVTPEGWPDADKPMAELNDPDTAVVIVDVPLLPLATETAVGEAEIVKFAGPTTVRLSVVVCVMPPPIPVMVIGYVPVTGFEATVRVTPEEPEPGAAIDAGLKPTVTPEGWPDADRAIAALKPPEMVAVTVDEPPLPWVTVTEAGEAERVKLGPDGVPASALSKPAPFILPQPVARS